MHVLADALTSVLAIGALVAGRYLGWVWLDPVMGIVGAVVISVWAWNLMRDTAAVLLDTADAHLEGEVRQEVEGLGDAKITDLHVWRIGPGAHAAIVSFTGDASAADVRQRLRRVHELAHVTVEPPMNPTARQCLRVGLHRCVRAARPIDPIGPDQRPRQGQGIPRAGPNRTSPRRHRFAAQSHRTTNSGAYPDSRNTCERPTLKFALRKRTSC
ncbi:hypothetical protein [Phenylobacterium sp. J367]|uniref:hypothetical protein n=1 Tax=Phenylobacterium sp. J367 TaxID=2898435 RepID=UPI00215159CD|nr:hypothetical protein [Phenylobacterium sp. J367]